MRGEFQLIIIVTVIGLGLILVALGAQPAGNAAATFEPAQAGLKAALDLPPQAIATASPVNLPLPTLKSSTELVVTTIGEVILKARGLINAALATFGLPKRAVLVKRQRCTILDRLPLSAAWEAI